MNLPADFRTLMCDHLGDEQAHALFKGLSEEPSVSVRLNPEKTTATLPLEPVPWCNHAYYLTERPAFTFDPLLHAGIYYVQEASSMYLDEVLRKFMPQGDIAALDLCAAPGGKSTLLRSRLTAGSLLVSNEPIRQRAQVLAENIVKWGNPSCVVTQNYPQDFSHLTGTFDLVVADVPCSGEGMFRKDPQAVTDWSLQNVDLCWRRQRDIVSHIWPTLKDGGLMVYSTCTFNRLEDEDNVLWIANELGAEVLLQRHFYPGRDRGEGFFIAALRKDGNYEPSSPRLQKNALELPFLSGDYVVEQTSSSRYALPTIHADLIRRLRRTLHTLVTGVELEQLKGRDWQPAHALALSSAYVRGSYPEVALNYEQAVAYLRREALHIPVPKGYVLLTYENYPIGFAKSVNGRLNNLYPQEWRIRTTYTPSVPVCLFDEINK